MGYHPRIETTKMATFQTTRTRRSELWFVNNYHLEQAILGYAAKYAARYSVKLYALAIEGNHIQFPARFPKANRAHFMRDFNSMVARAVPRHQQLYPSGRLWGRRYSAEYLPGEEDIEEQFFYTVLQPVQDGLVDSIYKYRSYNCFEDAIMGRTRTFKVIHWKEYNDARRWNPAVSIKDYTEMVPLTYERLPGYEHLSTKEYAQRMRAKLRARTKDILAQRKGKECMGEERLRQRVPGSLPHRTKVSTRTTHRPRILSKDDARRAAGKDWYFEIYFAFKEASALYRAGEREVGFPEGTYRPPMFTVANHDLIDCSCT